MRKNRVEVYPENCSGCLRCALACSETNNSFDINRSRVRVQDNGKEYLILFSDDCTGCRTCMEHCFYGALKKGAE